MAFGIGKAPFMLGWPIAGGAGLVGGILLLTVIEKADMPWALLSGDTEISINAIKFTSKINTNAFNRFELSSNTFSAISFTTTFSLLSINMLKKLSFRKQVARSISHKIRLFTLNTLLHNFFKIRFLLNLLKEIF